MYDIHLIDNNDYILVWTYLLEIFSGVYATDSIVIVFHIYFSVYYPCVCDLFGPF